MLFESCILATALAFVNPADPSGQTIYPSGIKDNGDFIFCTPPPNLSPLLKIESEIRLSDGSVLFPGNYCVRPSFDENKIFLIQGHDIFCECSIIQNSIVNNYAAVPTASLEYSKNKVILRYQIENILKKALLPVMPEN